MVAANAANPTVNTATVTGGGDPTCTNCSGTTTNPVIDAVNDASTGQPGQAGTFNVSTNDKFPVGSTFTQTATTCAGGDDDGRCGELHPPGDDGRELHGDVQRVRTGAEHDDLRHGGLTVTAGAAPALTVTKSATPAVLVVGGTGQVYTITISVANGPTTAAINVSDVLPAGSAPTERSRRRAGPEWLSGQGGDESGGLHGSVGHQWPGGDHGTGGGGGECGEPDGEHGDGDGWRDPTCTNCSGTTTNPVIDAVNDASTGQPGQAGTFNVSTNDKFPVGSTFTQTATTCVPAGTMTAGVANFTHRGRRARAAR